MATPAIIIYTPEVLAALGMTSNDRPRSPVISPTPSPLCAEDCNGYTCVRRSHMRLLERIGEVTSGLPAAEAVVNIKIWFRRYEESHGDGYCSGEEINPELTTDQIYTVVVPVPLSQYRAGRHGGICLTQFTKYNKTWSCHSERMCGGSGYCSGGTGSWQRVTRAEFVSPADEVQVHRMTEEEPKD